jgi:hypothetical protein
MSTKEEILRMTCDELGHMAKNEVKFPEETLRLVKGNIFTDSLVVTCLIISQMVLHFRLLKQFLLNFVWL